MILKTTQLPLDLQLPPRLLLADFMPGSNEHVLTGLQEFLSNQEPFLYLSGSEGSGKTHLLTGISTLAETKHLHSIYIPLKDLDGLAPDLLNGLENCDLVTLDDIHQLTNHPDWQQAVFTLFNRLRDKKKKLLIAANTGPSNLSFELADLASRMSWGITYRLEPLNDEQKLALLQKEAARRGLELKIDGARYLLGRCPRGMTSLISTLDLLDRASMASGRRLTLPFIREQLF